MSDVKVKAKIKELFVIMNQDIVEMVSKSNSSAKVLDDITSYVASKLAASSRGYMSSIYTTLSDKTLSNPEFQDIDHSNQFFNMELDKKIVGAYQFEVKDLPHFNDGIDYKEINRVYTSSVVGVGTATLGGALLGVLSGLVDIPVIGIIAGAIISGLAGFGISYVSVAPNINRNKMNAAVKSFLGNLEQELYAWVDGVEDFYNAQVEELKKTF